MQRNASLLTLTIDDKSLLVVTVLNKDTQEAFNTGKAIMQLCKINGIITHTPFNKFKTPAFKPYSLRAGARKKPI